MNAVCLDSVTPFLSLSGALYGTAGVVMVAAAMILGIWLVARIINRIDRAIRSTE